MEMSKYLPHLCPREYDREFRRLFCALHFLEPADLMLEHFLVEKEQRAERLVLSGRSDIEIAREVSEKLCYLFFRQIVRMTFPVKENETLDPVDISLLRANAVLFQPDGVAHLI